MQFLGGAAQVVMSLPVVQLGLWSKEPLKPCWHLFWGRSAEHTLQGVCLLFDVPILRPSHARPL